MTTWYAQKYHVSGELELPVTLQIDMHTSPNFIHSYHRWHGPDKLSLVTTSPQTILQVPVAAAAYAV